MEGKTLRDLISSFIVASRRAAAAPPLSPQHLHHHTILGRRGEDLGHGGEEIYITIIIYAATIDPLVVILDLVVDSFVYSYYYSPTIHMIFSMMPCAPMYE